MFTISREGHFTIRHVAWLTPDDPRIRKWQIFCWRMTYYEIIAFTIYYYKIKLCIMKLFLSQYIVIELDAGEFMAFKQYGEFMA